MCWHGPDQGTQDTSGKKFRRCFRSVDFVSDASSTLVAMDEEAQPQIVHRRRLRPAHRATDEPRDPRSSRDVCACMTVGGLPGTPRAVSRRPRACIALSPLCDYTAGASPAEASGKSNGRPRPRRHAWPRERCVPADVGQGAPYPSRGRRDRGARAGSSWCALLRGRLCRSDPLQGEQSHRSETPSPNVPNWDSRVVSPSATSLNQ